MTEYVDLYDNFRRKTNNIIKRRDKVPEGLYRLIIHVCLFNEKDQMLIQKRQKDKRSRPNKWDLSVSGAVSAGENSQQSAQRELEEELGIKYSFENLYPDISIKTKFRIDDIFLIDNYPIDLKKLSIQEEEVADVDLKNMEEILEMIDKGDFISYNKDYIKLLFYLRKNTSLFTK